MTDLAPVLTGCHVCRSPFVDSINKKMRDGLPDTKISEWLTDAGQYFSRITLGKHRREHLMDEHERLRQNAVKAMKKQQATIKTSGGDLAVLVRDYVESAVKDGALTPTLAEGLWAQEMIDRRQEKSAERDIALQLAEILGGSTATYQVLEAREVKQIGVEEEA